MPFDYSHQSRTHLGLDKDTPDARPVEHSRRGGSGRPPKSVACILPPPGCVVSRQRENPQPRIYIIPPVLPPPASRLKNASALRCRDAATFGRRDLTKPTTLPSQMNRKDRHASGIRLWRRTGLLRGQGLPPVERIKLPFQSCSAKARCGATEGPMRGIGERRRDSNTTSEDQTALNISVLRTRR